MKLYIAVLDEFPDYMVPTLVAHSILGAHLHFSKWLDVTRDGSPYKHPIYMEWLETSFKKCVVRVNQKEFDKIAAIHNTYLGHENTILNGQKSCAIPVPCKNEDIPNVLKFAKLWKPKSD